jgi:hypothetical protein
MTILIPAVLVVVHPIDLAEHPSYQPGYRWAVMVGGGNVADLDYCVAAGGMPDQSSALVAGESHGSAACKALRILGVNATYSVSSIDYDPIPNECDNRPLVRFE